MAACHRIVWSLHLFFLAEIDCTTMIWIPFEKLLGIPEVRKGLVSGGYCWKNDLMYLCVYIYIYPYISLLWYFMYILHHTHYIYMYICTHTHIYIYYRNVIWICIPVIMVPVAQLLTSQRFLKRLGTSLFRWLRCHRKRWSASTVPRTNGWWYRWSIHVPTGPTVTYAYLWYYSFKSLSIKEIFLCMASAQNYLQIRWSNLNGTNPWWVFGYRTR